MWACIYLCIYTSRKESRKEQRKCTGIELCMIVVGHVHIFVYDLKKEEEECNLKSIKKGLKLLYQRG